MWEWMSERYIYRKFNHKHCSVWYDVYIHRWRWSVVEFIGDEISIHQGSSGTASLAMTESIERETT
jgi:hypothetical protein